MPRKNPPITIRVPLDESVLFGGRMPHVMLDERTTTGKYRPSVLEGDPANINRLQAYKKGGKVKKTGLAKLHKGERVLTAKQAKSHAKTSARKRLVAKKPAPRTRRR